MKFLPGETVQLTGKFLRNTGQITGREGMSRWIVQACDCGLCRTGSFVCTNERKSAESLRGYTEAELAAHPSLYLRHINAGNLKHYGKPSVRDC